MTALAGLIALVVATGAGAQTSIGTTAFGCMAHAGCIGFLLFRGGLFRVNSLPDGCGATAQHASVKDAWNV